MLESAGCVSQRQGMYAGRSVLVPFIIFVLICGFGGFPTKAEIRGGWSLRHQPFSLLTRQETGEKKTRDRARAFTTTFHDAIVP